MFSKKIKLTIHTGGKCDLRRPANRDEKRTRLLYNHRDGGACAGDLYRMRLGIELGGEARAAGGAPAEGSSMAIRAEERVAAAKALYPARSGRPEGGPRGAGRQPAKRSGGPRLRCFRPRRAIKDWRSLPEIFAAMKDPDAGGPRPGGGGGGGDHAPSMTKFLRRRPAGKTRSKIRASNSPQIPSPWNRGIPSSIPNRRSEHEAVRGSAVLRDRILGW